MEIEVNTGISIGLLVTERQEAETGSENVYSNKILDLA